VSNRVDRQVENLGILQAAAAALQPTGNKPIAMGSIKPSYS